MTRRRIQAPSRRPDDTVRTIWPANAKTLNSRICSASSTRRVAVTSPEIAQIVAEVYTQHLALPPEWTPAQRQSFLDKTAATLSRQIAELAAELGEQAVQEWTTEHGQYPDYLTKVGLLNTATTSAKEIVLNDQLYELIPPPPQPQEQNLEPPSGEALPWTQRWTRTQYRTEPDETVEALVASLWPDPEFSALFRIKAGYLLAARAEDQLPQPRQVRDPLTVELAEMVYQDLRDDGLPAR
jgi:hypothetical protein